MGVFVPSSEPVVFPKMRPVNCEQHSRYISKQISMISKSLVRVFGEVTHTASDSEYVISNRSARAHRYRKMKWVRCAHVKAPCKQSVWSASPRGTDAEALLPGCLACHFKTYPPSLSAWRCTKSLRRSNGPDLAPALRLLASTAYCKRNAKRT